MAGRQGARAPACLAGPCRKQWPCPAQYAASCRHRALAARWQFAPVKAVADGAAAAHELEEQEQGLRGDSQGAGVHKAEQCVCRWRARGRRNQSGTVAEQSGAERRKAHGGGMGEKGMAGEQETVACTNTSKRGPARKHKSPKPRAACPPTCVRLNERLHLVSRHIREGTAHTCRQ